MTTKKNDSEFTDAERAAKVDAKMRAEREKPKPNSLSSAASFRRLNAMVLLLPAT